MLRYINMKTRSPRPLCGIERPLAAPGTLFAALGAIVAVSLAGWGAGPAAVVAEHPRAALRTAVPSAGSGAGRGSSTPRTWSASPAPCPSALSPGRWAAEGVLRAAQRTSPQYDEVVGLESLNGYSLGTDQVWVRAAIEACGAVVAKRSWVVFIIDTRFLKGSNRSPSLAEHASLFALTTKGWCDWSDLR